MITRKQDSTLEIGAIVISKSGRDKGSGFIVTKIEQEYVFLCDGKVRPMSNQKRKNQKHLQRTRYIAQEIAEKIVSQGYLLDSDFRKAIKAFVNKQNDTGKETENDG
jgi:ribosomal protein L14E/L6E/L27E